MFKSFSYIYDEEKFVAALANDVIIVTDLPLVFKEARKKNKFPIFKPESTASPSYYINVILPKLKKAKVIGLKITDGGCLQVQFYFVQLNTSCKFKESCLFLHHLSLSGKKHSLNCINSINSIGLSF